jgi:hypothetical protein
MTNGDPREAVMARIAADEHEASIRAWLANRD